jgi:hypothetical protein
MVVQDGRRALLQPGDFSLFDAADSYDLLFPDGMDIFFFRIPRAALGMSVRQFRDATAVTLGSGSAVAELTSTYLTRLAATGTPPYGRHGVLISEPTIDLIRATVATHLDDPGLYGAAATGTLPCQVMSYLRTHLTDPELSPAAVAAAHHISLARAPPGDSSPEVVGLPADVGLWAGVGAQQRWDVGRGVECVRVERPGVER